MYIEDPSGDAATSFYSFDPSRITAALALMRRHFRGQLLYAVKANPCDPVVQHLVALGIDGFDVASSGEIAEVQGYNKPIFFMNPVKTRAAIKAAYSQGVRQFVIDCHEELDKFLDLCPHDDNHLRLFVRYRTHHGGAVFHLSDKFGADSATVAQLVSRIQQHTRWAMGLAFHVGSQTVDPDVFLQALEQAHELTLALQQPFSALDIGGGFAGDYLNSTPTVGVDQLLSQMSQKIEQLPGLSTLELFAEPGRFLVYQCLSLFAQVTLCKGSALYLSEGVYSGLADAQQWLHIPARAWRQGRKLELEPSHSYTLYGPTCDGLDRLGFAYELPDALREGDWLEFFHNGAYSLSLATRFNGFQSAEVFQHRADSSLA